MIESEAVNGMGQARLAEIPLMYTLAGENNSRCHGPEGSKDEMKEGQINGHNSFQGFFDPTVLC